MQRPDVDDFEGAFAAVAAFDGDAVTYCHRPRKWGNHVRRVGL